MVIDSRSELSVRISDMTPEVKSQEVTGAALETFWHVCQALEVEENELCNADTKGSSAFRTTATPRSHLPAGGDVKH